MKYISSIKEASGIYFRICICSRAEAGTRGWAWGWRFKWRAVGPMLCLLMRSIYRHLFKARTMSSMFLQWRAGGGEIWRWSRYYWVRTRRFRNWSLHQPRIVRWGKEHPIHSRISFNHKNAYLAKIYTIMLSSKRLLELTMNMICISHYSYVQI